jgi:penicillin-binding protein 1C
MMRRGLRAAAAVVLLAALSWAGADLWRGTDPDVASLTLAPSTLVTDREGRVLRFLPGPDGQRHLFVPLASIPPVVGGAFLAAEDRRFHRHRGVDWLALARAVADGVREGRIVSGASTITQQLCRLSRPRGRNPLRKAEEMLRSLRLERAIGKERILELYLNRVPLGNNVAGVEAASRLYFGRAAADLLPSQAALLASLPKAPGRLNPYGAHLPRLLERRDRVLERMREMGLISPEECRLARAAPPDLLPRDFPLEAPHLTDLVLARGAVPDGGGVIRTTLDLPLQRRVEEVLASHRERLLARGARQAAAVVIHNPTLEVRALAGSLGWGPVGGGFVNGATALRSPGSTLKPFLYALALERGSTPAALLEDVRRVYRFPGGEYRPENFDRVAHGPVLLEDALGNSLNLAAVTLLNRVGPSRLYRRLELLGLINHPGLGPDHYGLGLVVGNPEVSLLQLTAAYAALANGGEHRRPRLLADEPPSPKKAVFTPQAAHLVLLALADPSSRAVAFGASWAMNAVPGMAVKTGTSTRYRDGWSVGCTPPWTVGIWAGNFDGEPTWRLSGAGGAAPILAEVVQALHPSPPPAFPRPDHLAEAAVCAHSGMNPGPRCTEVRLMTFLAGTEPSRICTFHAPEGDGHRLPTRFASWLHQRRGRGGEGRYRLEEAADPGALPVSDGAATAAADPRRPGPAGPGGPGIEIVYPLDGDRYLLEPGADGQTVTLEAVSDIPLRDITWYVDGLPHQAAPPPYRAECTLSPGRHTITALGETGSGDSITVTVE